MLASWTRLYQSCGLEVNNRCWSARLVFGVAKSVSQFEEVHNNEVTHTGMLPFSLQDGPMGSFANRSICPTLLPPTTNKRASLGNKLSRSGRHLITTSERQNRVVYSSIFEVKKANLWDVVHCGWCKWSISSPIREPSGKLTSFKRDKNCYEMYDIRVSARMIWTCCELTAIRTAATHSKVRRTRGPDHARAT